MAASRWVGRGDKLGRRRRGRGHANGALHRADGRHRGDRRGREGQRADALQREKIGDGTPQLTYIAVDPIDGTTLTAQGPWRRWRSLRWPSAAPCSTRARACTWRSWRSGPGPRARATSAAPRQRTSTHSPMHSAPGARLVPRSSSTGRATRAFIAEGHRRPHPSHHRRRRGRCDRDRLARRRRRHPVRHRRHPEGVIRRMRSCAVRRSRRFHPRNEEERAAAIEAGYQLDAA